MKDALRDLGNGLLLRVGNGRENAASKGLRYLIQGRVQIRRAGSDHVEATVRGNGRAWTVEYRDGWWRCDCPARSKCAHRHAVEQVVVVE
ncbi:MAG: hypothetical protein ACR2KQ_09910 [Actinomycetota bacterium]